MSGLIDAQEICRRVSKFSETPVTVDDFGSWMGADQHEFEYECDAGDFKKFEVAMSALLDAVVADPDMKKHWKKGATSESWLYEFLEDTARLGSVPYFLAKDREGNAKMGGILLVKCWNDMWDTMRKITN